MKQLVRLGNADIFGNVPVYHALCKIKGVSTSFANAVCNVLDLNRRQQIGELTDQQLQQIEDTIKNPTGKIPSFCFNRRRDNETGKDMHIISTDLRLKQEFDLRLMKKLKTYKGRRHVLGLPVRGQRTKGNFRRGSAVGVVKKKQQPGTVVAKPAAKKE